MASTSTTSTGANTVPERLINYRVYNSNKDLLGIASVDLPEITAMSDTISGAGIAGEVESPVLGHYQSMTTSFTWRTIEKLATDLVKIQAHEIEIRGAQQSYDAANGQYKVVPVRAFMRVVPKGITLGSFEPGSTVDCEQEFEVLYIKLYVDGKEAIEIDKFNYVTKVGGEDMLADVKSALGLA